MSDTSKPLEVAGLKIPADGERKFELIAAAISIVAFIWYLKAKASQSASAGSVGTESTDTGSGTTDTTSTDDSSLLTQLEQQITQLQSESQTSVTFGFSDNTGGDLTSNDTESGSATSTGSSSGSGGLSILGIGFGGGSGSSNKSSTQTGSATQAVNNAYSNGFTADTTITGGSTDEITGIENWLTSLAGTYEQRVAGSVIQSNEGYDYLFPTQQSPNVTGTVNQTSDLSGTGGKNG